MKKEDDFTRPERWFSRTLAVACALTAVAVWWTATRPVARTTPGGLEQGQARSEAELRKLSQPFDQPNAAEELYRRKRVPAGVELDTAALYRAAREHMLDMPGYSTRQQRFLPSERELRRRSRRPRRGANPLPLRTSAELGSWESIGPGNIGGRTRALLIHPRKPRIRWAAGVSGGVWKTENAARSWRPLADLMTNIAVNSLAMDPADPEVIYAGTGEGYYREVVRGTDLPLRGAGIFKTEDGGETWSHLKGTFGADFRWVNDIVVSPVSSRRVYAATRTGVWRSRDHGRSWMRVLDPDVLGGCFDLVIRTDRDLDDEVLAACGTFEQATVWRRTAAQRGHSDWTPVLTEEGMGRTSLALAPADQDVVYALSASYLPGPGGRYEGGLHAVFRSDRGGAAGSWTAVVRNSDPEKLNTLLLSHVVSAYLVDCGFAEEDRYSTLGWYTNTIAVDPLDPDIVWAGGPDLFRSDDGGRNWGLVTYWWDWPRSAHADQHAVVFHPGYDGTANQKLFLAGDGGIWGTPNARAAKATGPNAACDPANTEVRWASHNRNYGVTQFYHGAAFPGGRAYFGGTQDNGTLLGADAWGSDGWVDILGGDGGYVAVDPNEADILYAETQWGNLRKSTDGGSSFASAVEGIAEPAENFLFITPFAMDPSDSRRLWIGGRRLWRTDDGASSWTAASATLSAEAKVSAIAVAPTDPNRVVVGMNDGTIFFTDQALSANGTTEWTSSRPRAGGWVSSLAFHPEDADVIYTTYSTFGGQHVFRSLHGGGGPWRQMDGTGPRRLPGLPVHSIVIDPTNPKRIFVGTDLGVFVSTAGGRRWAVENTGFARAVTESLSVARQPDGTAVLYAFTHGRGAWRIPIGEFAEPPDDPPSDFRLVEVATSELQWVGVAVSPHGRIFINYRFGSPGVRIAVGEIIAGEVVPYPNEEINEFRLGSPGDHFLRVQSVHVDRDGFLWILDNAKIGAGIAGGAKLVKVDLASDEVVQTIFFSPQIAGLNRFLNDVRVDTERQVAYLSDSGGGALVVVDLTTGTSRRVLAGDASTRGERGVVLRVGGVEWRYPDGSLPRIHVDGLALTPEREYLYYQALTGRTLYRIPTRDLRDASLSNQVLSERVERVGEFGASDAIAFAPDGHLYLTSLEYDAIRRLTPAGELEVVVQDPRISWPDSFAITDDGTVYFTTSQIHLGDLPPEPYRLFRIEGTG